MKCSVCSKNFDGAEYRHSHDHERDCPNFEAFVQGQITGDEGLSRRVYRCSCGDSCPECCKVCREVTARSEAV